MGACAFLPGQRLVGALFYFLGKPLGLRWVSCPLNFALPEILNSRISFAEMLRKGVPVSL